MGTALRGRHLQTIIQMKVIYEYVLNEEFHTAREMYPSFVEAIEKHTKLEPVLGHNFIKVLDDLVNDGKAERAYRQDFLKDGGKIRQLTRLWRKL